MEIPIYDGNYNPDYVNTVAIKDIIHRLALYDYPVTKFDYQAIKKSTTNMPNIDEYLKSILAVIDDTTYIKLMNDKRGNKISNIIKSYHNVATGKSLDLTNDDVTNLQIAIYKKQQYTYVELIFKYIFCNLNYFVNDGIQILLKRGNNINLVTRTFYLTVNNDTKNIRDIQEDTANCKIYNYPSIDSNTKYQEAFDMIWNMSKVAVLLPEDPRFLSIKDNISFIVSKDIASNIIRADYINTKFTTYFSYDTCSNLCEKLFTYLVKFNLDNDQKYKDSYPGNLNELNDIIEVIRSIPYKYLTNTYIEVFSSLSKLSISWFFKYVHVNTQLSIKHSCENDKSQLVFKKITYSTNDDQKHTSTELTKHDFIKECLVNLDLIKEYSAIDHFVEEKNTQVNTPTTTTKEEDTSSGYNISFHINQNKDERLSWTEYFKCMCQLIALRSTCLRRKVGAILVKDNRIISTGYNGAPKSVKHCSDRGGCYRQKNNIPSGEQLYSCYASHAESNAITQAACYGVSTNGAELYCTNKPCSMCAKTIIQAGIVKVYYENDYPDKLTDELFKEANVLTYKI